MECVELLYLLKKKRICVCSAGCRLLQDLEVKHVEVDACGDAQSAAEGAMLGLFHYDQLKSKKKTKVTTGLHGRYTQRDPQMGVCEPCTLQHCTHRVPVCVCSTDTAAWDKGLLYGEGQNLARFLMEAPANHITPTVFANTIEEKLAPHAELVAVEKRFVLNSTLPSSSVHT